PDGVRLHGGDFGELSRGRDVHHDVLRDFDSRIANRGGIDGGGDRDAAGDGAAADARGGGGERGGAGEAGCVVFAAGDADVERPGIDRGDDRVGVARGRLDR